MNNKIRINHIGIVVKSIDKYLKNSIYTEVSKMVFDSIQNANIVLIKTSDSEPDIELIEPTGKNATTYNFLVKRGGGIHHICYEIENEEVLNMLFSESNYKLIYGPAKAVLFDNKKVAFGFNRNKEIVEFLLLS